MYIHLLLMHQDASGAKREVLALQCWVNGNKVLRLCHTVSTWCIALLGLPIQAHGVPLPAHRCLSVWAAVLTAFCCVKAVLMCVGPPQCWVLMYCVSTNRVWGCLLCSIARGFLCTAQEPACNDTRPHLMPQGIGIKHWKSLAMSAGMLTLTGLSLAKVTSCRTRSCATSGGVLARLHDSAEHS